MLRRGRGVWGVLAAVVAQVSLTRAMALGVLVPAYFGAGAGWDSLNAAAERVPLIAILNPNSGPGNAVNSGYAAAVKALRQSHGRVIGYVHTSYATRPVEQVRTEIDRYYSFYELDGIFVDEMTNDSVADHLAYYQSLYAHVKAKDRSHIVIGNPGSRAPAAYVTRPVVDTLVTFENRTGYDNYVPDPWTKTQPAAALAHLCYSVANAQTASNYVNLAVARNAGFIYVTDDGGNNPWDRLPSYWAEEIAQVEQINREAARSSRAELRIEPATESSIQVQVLGTAGRYVLQSSRDFFNWKPEATNLSATGNWSFVVSRPGLYPAEWFRTEQ